MEDDGEAVCVNGPDSQGRQSLAEADGMDGQDGQGLAEADGVDGQGADEFDSGRIYCANCIHCKLVPAKLENEEGIFLRVRCSAGNWRKKLGEEKLYKYCTITRRHLHHCDSYEEMGDTREFIRELRKTLPSRDEPYTFLRNS
jgi:hypothetical protein